MLLSEPELAHIHSTASRIFGDDNPVRTSFYSALKTIPIQRVLHFRATQGNHSRSLISIPHTTSLEEGLEVMRKENIQAIPIYRLINNDRKEYLGIVNVWDIVSATVFQKLFDEMKKSESIEDFRKLIEDEGVFLNQPVGNLLGLSDESRESWTLHSKEHVSTLLQFLSSANYHRVVVIDDEKCTDDIPDAAVTIITQSDLCEFLYQERYILGGDKRYIDSIFSGFITAQKVIQLQPESQDANQPVSSRRHVITVPESYTALNAFKVLYVHRVSAVAVVNGRGALVANLSASDLRGITRKNLDSLCFDNVYRFLEQGEKRAAGSIGPDQLKVCTEEDKLSDLICLMLQNKIHHLWMVDEKEVPKGCIAFTDLLRVFVSPGSEE